MDIDQIFRQVGELGSFQIFNEFMLCISVVPAAFAIMLPYFTQYNPSWKCIGNSTVCVLTDIMDQGHIHYKDRCGMPRTEWTFTEDKYYSIVTEFDLYCDTEIYSYVATSLTFLFWAIGGLIIGWIADRFGRVKVIVTSGLSMIVVGFISAFSPNFAIYAICRAIIGFFVPGSIIQLFIFAAEISTTRHRPLLGLLLGGFFTVGLLLLGLIAYFIREWKILTIVCTAPFSTIYPFYIFVPESVRWLHAHGKHQKALEVIRKIAKANGKVADNINLPPLHESAKKDTNPLDIFRPSKVAISTFIQAFGWFVNGMVYYGISLSADDLGGSIYRDYVLASLVEFPALATAIYICKRFGRKKTITIPMFIGSVALIVVSLIPAGSKIAHWTVLRVCIGMVGKFFITASFNTIYIWSTELYPTLTRAVGMGFMQITCRSGSALAPWITKWLKVFHVVLPFAVMGVSTFISAILLLWLPETGFSPLSEIDKPIANTKSEELELRSNSEYNTCDT